VLELVHNRYCGCRRSNLSSVGVHNAIARVGDRKGSQSSSIWFGYNLESNHLSGSDIIWRRSSHRKGEIDIYPVRIQSDVHIRFGYIQSGEFHIGKGKNNLEKFTSESLEKKFTSERGIDIVRIQSERGNGHLSGSDTFGKGKWLSIRFGYIIWRSSHRKGEIQSVEVHIGKGKSTAVGLSPFWDGSRPGLSPFFLVSTVRFFNSFVCYSDYCVETVRFLTRSYATLTAVWRRRQTGCHRPVTIFSGFDS
jgi:hypothetical protein